VQDNQKIVKRLTLIILEKSPYFGYFTYHMYSKTDKYDIFIFCYVNQLTFI